MSIKYWYVTQYVVVKGNPFDGFDIVGPFDGQIEALEWAERNIGSGTTWWELPLEVPAS